MIERYTRPAMKAIWDLKHKYEIWLEVELQACGAFERAKQAPRGTAAKIRKNAKINVERIAEIEKVTKHDVIAFLESLMDTVGPEHRYLHMGLTSSDIVDTSLAVQMTEAMDLILEGVDGLLVVLKRQAFRYKDQVMVGRSHGIHGEPISFGLKLALWHEEVRRHQERLRQVRRDIAVGKLSGAMGTFAHQGPEIEEYVCEKLGLKPDPVSNQVVQRDRHASYATALALLAATIEKFATEIRHLQRTEVLEAEEYFSEGQKGSSAMPHKRNPIVSENLCGLARVVRANSLAAMENVALWHERDISHSSVERVIMPDSTILVDYMLAKVTDLIDHLVIYPDRMKRNLELTGGLVYSQRLLLALVEKGAQRKESYEAVQRNAMTSWRGGGRLQDLVNNDPFISRHLTKQDISTCFNPKYYLRHLDRIYQRVFGRTQRRASGAKKGNSR
ncbi:MAG: adenylosuccinate lyase [Nitrospira sp.]|nr:adenylosuccinate lyase [Nitrospira sp.]MDH4245191.1 adenylosuccinate lyase [Nitrospira sp.]MDH4356609.1 adenylosuccinate lyase [Nitrospira sp.]MDH5318512.1 adenylosuccinate lyase [Nitrospira sp.]